MTATFGGLFLLRFLPFLALGAGRGLPEVLVKIGDTIHHELGKSLVSISIDLDLADLACDSESRNLFSIYRLRD